MAINTKKYIEQHLYIRTKESNIKLFKLNKPQERLYKVLADQYSRGVPLRVIILKARQLGFSTCVGGISFKGTTTEFNVNTTIVAHREDATRNLFEMYKLFYERLDDDIKPAKRKSNAYELSFDNEEGTGLKSKIVCYTAGGQGIGRSTTINNLHLSEYAFWPGEKEKTLSGLLQAVPRSKESMVIIESTANGYEQFKDMWDAAVNGENDFYPLFVAWFELPEYSMDARGLQPTNEEKVMKELYHLTNRQLAWRRWCIANNCNGDINQFKQEYPSNPTEAFLASGEGVFEKEQIANQIERVRNIKPIKRGFFDYNKTADLYTSEITDIKWIEDSNGYIEIREEPVRETDPIRLKPYVLGGDTAGLGTDYFTAKVIDNITKKTVATLWKQKINEDLYADQVYCLGKYYNEALIGLEINFSTLPTRELERLQYPNMYMRERMDTLSNRMQKAFGFDTNMKTRPVMIGELVRLMREDSTLEEHIPTLKEMLTFIKNSRGKATAQEGYHDDLVIALAIAHFISTQQKSTWTVKVEDKPDFVTTHFNLKKKGKGNEDYQKW